MPGRLSKIVSVVALVAAALVVGATARPAAAAPVPPAPPSAGYWTVASDGGVFSFGNAAFHGSTGDLKLNKPVVGMAATPSGAGYWFAASDGGVFNFGDAAFKGSAGSIKLNKPIVGMAPTPSGNGYWLVASDGGIFNYGTAPFKGSAGSIKLNKPIVGMAPTPSGLGYWLVASDGGVFNYGDASFFGSTGGLQLAKPVVGIAGTSTGKGYWLVASDGGIFAFGDAAFFGSAGAMSLKRPVVSLVPTRFGKGYWLVGSDGGIFAYGDAPYEGSTGSLTLNAPIVGMATTNRPAYAEVSAFYYPWYGNPDFDKDWRHWNDLDHQPPDDIASSYYPVRGPYSSNDPTVVDAQMAEVASAGIDTIVSSWWGPGSFEDKALPAITAAANRHGVHVALHLEPYDGRTPASFASELPRLEALGITDVYIYLADTSSASAWRAVTNEFPDVRFFGKGSQPPSYLNAAWQNYAVSAGFRGIYTYDPISFSPAELVKICAMARARHLLCSPSVSPGFDGDRGEYSAPTPRDRENGAVYDASWQAVLADGAPDIVSITSYNEWHEGTQIEPAAPSHCITGGFCYLDFTGAYGVAASAAPTAYLTRTAYWTAQAHAGTG